MKAGGKYGQGYSHHKITEFYAWIGEEPDGGEGIPSVALPSEQPGVLMAWPLVSSDRARAEELREHALAALGAGYPVKLVRFTKMEVIERHEPDVRITRA